MTKPNFSSQLKYYLLTHKKKPPEGFSLVEIMVAMTILSIAFAINLQFLLLLRIQNLEQKVVTGAVSLSREILEGTRARWNTTVETIPQFRQTPTSVTPIVTTNLNNPGTTTFALSEGRRKDFGGYKYNVVVNICSNEDPTIIDDNEGF
ncbi:type IV pilus modification PilV family protein [Geminocystis herdmanii]|uniref:type IV pilus modification PilV family protein n=1 Tax=Geminocystis herdmanii TaxID=669359 RepID=UPI0003482215|nr:prepilin-type N-terminal cleavage/methylation domain-containing protein [Geminocystis herdmanii]